MPLITRRSPPFYAPFNGMHDPETLPSQLLANFTAHALNRIATGCLLVSSKRSAASDNSRRMSLRNAIASVEYRPCFYALRLLGADGNDRSALPVRDRSWNPRRRRPFG
jgi:hypothetical protein